MEDVMKELWSSRWLCLFIPAIASTLGPVLLVATIRDALADHAIGTEAQLAWQARLLKVEQAMARGDFAEAETLWREAYAAALKSRHWEGVIATGDTYRALGARAGFRAASVSKARQAYLTALFRARSEGSLAGVLITAERFAELGDREVVERCISVARKVAAQSRDPYAGEHLRAFTERWAASAQENDGRGLTP
ncbi:MAG: hypothetical protein DMD87_18655 [Candidatus Rokuibacteriota bacterium]|nr:MAG: hypothetical protein DMD87_18655 [Candidatus Rokubacteria bacterium]